MLMRNLNHHVHRSYLAIVKFLAIRDLDDNFLPLVHDSVVALTLCLEAKAEKAWTLEMVCSHAFLWLAAEFDDHSQV